jgi:hypothetical protein
VRTTIEKPKLCCVGFFLWKGKTQMETFLGIPAILLSLGALIGGAITGLLYLVGVFGKSRGQSAREANDASDYVIKSFREKIEVLEQKVAEQAEELRQMSTRLEILISENKTLREVLQGRDQETKELQTGGLKAIQQTGQILQVTMENNQQIKNLYELLAKHFAGLAS